MYNSERQAGCEQQQRARLSLRAAQTAAEPRSTKQSHRKQQAADQRRRHQRIRAQRVRRFENACQQVDQPHVMRVAPEVDERTLGVAECARLRQAPRRRDALLQIRDRGEAERRGHDQLNDKIKRGKAEQHRALVRFKDFGFRRAPQQQKKQKT